MRRTGTQASHPTPWVDQGEGVLVLKRNGFTLSEDSKDLASKSSSRELPTPKRRKRLEPCVVLGCACVERTSDRHKGGRVEAFSTESGLAGRTAEGHHHSRHKNFMNSVGSPQQVPTDDMATAHPPPPPLEGLFGSPFERKVIVSMSLGHSALFKLRRRAPENTHSQIWLDHGDLLVMDGLTQLEYEHSTASELLGPRVNLTFRWMSQHIKSCPLAGLIGGALPSDAQDLAEPHSRGGGSRNSKCP